MFTAMLMICSLAQPNDCMLFTDTRDLYGSKEECMVRIQEMKNDLLPTLPDVATEYRYKCDNKIGTAT